MTAARQKIAVLNNSTLVSAGDFTAMVEACRMQLSLACHAWGRQVPTISHQTASAPDDSTTLTAHANELIESGHWVLVLVDDADQAGALGWHTEEAGEVFGFVFARPSYDAGSGSLAGEYAVSSVLSHELLETVMDPDVNTWWQIDSTALVAAEVCDPVEDGSYNVVTWTSGTVVVVSNYVLPSWGDPNNGTGPFDAMGVCSKPFDVTPGSYVVLWDTAHNRVGQVYGEKFPEWKRRLKERQVARPTRRLGDIIPR